MMDARFQRRIQRYGWDKAAGAYEDGWRHSLSPAQSELLTLAAAQPGESVLDMACGTGLVTLPLAETVGRRGNVLATDISEKMVEGLRATATERGLAHLTAFRADAEDIPDVPNGCMDLVTCAFGLMYVPNPAQALAEAWRILKPGGRAIFAVWGERAKCGWAEIFPIVDARVQSAVCPLFFQLGTGGTLARDMERAGFGAVQTRRLTSFLPYENDLAALEAAFAGGPVALAHDRFDEATRSEAYAEYLTSIAPYWTEDGYRIPGEFVICCGRKSGG